MKIIHSFLLPLTLIATLLLTGCATMFGDNTRNVKVNSNPEGAAVYLGAAQFGVTPTTVYLPQHIYNNIYLRLEKPGYATQNIAINSVFQPVGLWNILNLPFWGIGFIIDGANGNMVKVNPDQLNMMITLQSATSAASVVPAVAPKAK